MMTTRLSMMAAVLMAAGCATRSGVHGTAVGADLVPAVDALASATLVRVSSTDGSVSGEALLIGSSRDLCADVRRAVSTAEADVAAVDWDGLSADEAAGERDRILGALTDEVSRGTLLTLALARVASPDGDAEVPFQSGRFTPRGAEGTGDTVFEGTLMHATTDPWTFQQGALDIDLSDLEIRGHLATTVARDGAPSSERSLDLSFEGPVCEVQVDAVADRLF